MGSPTVKRIEEARRRVERYVDEVVDALKRFHEVVFEAYPGFGKTLLGLEVSTRLGRCLYVTRTLAEVSTVLSIADMMGIRAGPLYGRMQLCHVLSSTNPYLFSSLCRARRALGMCREDVTRDLVARAAKALYPDDLRELGKSCGVCIYRAHLVASLSRRVIVTTYEYLHNHPEIASKVSDRIAVLDECHTLVDSIEKFVERVSLEDIEALALELRRPYPRLSYALRRIARSSPSVEDALHKIVELYDTDIEGGEALEPIVNAVRSGRVVVGSDGAAYIVKPMRVSVGTLRLYMTAYVPPMLAASMHRIAIEDPPMRIPTRIDTSITTRYSERSEKLMDELADIVASYIDRDCATLVVLPSHSLAEEIRRRLLLKGFRLAPPSSISSVDRGTVVIDVAGGRATEGVTPSKSLRRVIVAGMPYPPPDPRLEAASRVYGFDAVYTYIAMLRTVQAVGRLMRWGGDAVLIDRRFKKYVHLLPKWMDLV